MHGFFRLRQRNKSRLIPFHLLIQLYFPKPFIKNSSSSFVWNWKYGNYTTFFTFKGYSIHVLDNIFFLSSLHLLVSDLLANVIIKWNGLWKVINRMEIWLKVVAFNFANNLVVCGNSLYYNSWILRDLIYVNENYFWLFSKFYPIYRNHLD